METTFIYALLILIMLIPLIQVYISINYFKRFAFEYLSNIPSSWNPDYDRSALVFSVCFGLFSVYLAKLIWQGNTDNSWFLTFIYLLLIILFSTFSIYYISFVQKDKKLQINRYKVDNKIWIDIDSSMSLLAFNFFINTKKISANTNKDDFCLIFSDSKIKTKVIWTSKYNGRLTYVTLILFYKIILKENYFTKEIVKREIEKKFLFEKKDPNTGEVSTEKLDIGSFNNAFTRINFDNLVQYQQEEFDKYSKIFK